MECSVVYIPRWLRWTLLLMLSFLRTARRRGLRLAVPFTPMPLQVAADQMCNSRPPSTGSTVPVV